MRYPLSVLFILISCAMLAVAEDSSSTTASDFKKSTAPYMKQLRSLQKRLETGITLADYRKKVSDLADTLGDISDPPDLNCEVAMEQAKFIVKTYTDAEEVWADEIQSSDQRIKSEWAKLRQKHWSVATEITAKLKLRLAESPSTLPTSNPTSNPSAN